MSETDDVTLSLHGANLTVDGDTYVVKEGEVNIQSETIHTFDGGIQTVGRGIEIEVESLCDFGESDTDTDATPPAVPPWKPIADWLASLPNVSCDSDRDETRESHNATQQEVRRRYEKTAKTIAYEVAVNADNKSTND